MKTNSKSLGGAFERKVASQLSYWMFDDPHVLKREPTSGGSKSVYCGDIFPMKQITWKTFPLLVECKCGYTNLTPTLLNYSIVETWYLKALKESKQSNGQDIILLIQNFKNKRGILLSTNIELDQIVYKCVLCIKNNGGYEYVFCYDYNEMLKYRFVDVFSGKIQEMIS